MPASLLKLGLFKRLICILSLIGVFGSANGQNLVPNPSFEDYYLCPNRFSQTNRLNFWHLPPAHWGTTDYYNICSTTGYVSVPNNHMGMRYPPDGDAYIGMFLLDGIGENYREYLQTKLIEPLNKGEEYFISFKYSVADSSAYSVDQFHIYFSKEKNISLNHNNNIPVKPQWGISQQLVANGDWVSVTFKYIAAGDEVYMCMGNFSEDKNTHVDTIRHSSSTIKFCYIYIDGVQVERGPCFFKLPPDSTLCKGEYLELTNSIPNSNSLWQNVNQQKSFVVTEPGIYHLTVSTDTCSHTDSIVVNFIECDTIHTVPKPIVEMPNVFTPNGDGINDRFDPIKMENISHFNVDIINRWGKKIYSFNDIIYSWNGLYFQKKTDDGVYFWILTYFDLSGNEHRIEGTVTLIR